MIVLLSAVYGLSLYGYLMEWRKNPHWSFSCCLTLLLPLNDLQGDIRDMAGTNVLKTQLNSGQFEMVTLHAAIKDSGTFDVTLGENEEGDEDDGDIDEIKADNSQGIKYGGKKYDQGSQTELLSHFTNADDTVHELIEEKQL